MQAVNSELINLYWQIGEYISNRVADEGWGESVVVQLAEYLQMNEPDLKGFSDKNLWRMKQFYETYKDAPKLSPLLREISWSNNLAVMARCKTIEEKEFYLRLSANEKYSFRELERQINTGVFERTMLGNQKLSTVLREFNADVANVFKDKYVFEFLDLPEEHSESDLERALVENFKDFILEIGKGFAYLGRQYRLQVGNHDYYLDLLFYQRDLQCLVNFELKIKEFKPRIFRQTKFLSRSIRPRCKESARKSEHRRFTMQR